MMQTVGPDMVRILSDYRKLRPKT